MSVLTKALVPGHKLPWYTWHVVSVTENEISIYLILINLKNLNFEASGYHIVWHMPKELGEDHHDFFSINFSNIA